MVKSESTCKPYVHTAFVCYFFFFLSFFLFTKNLSPTKTVTRRRFLLTRQRAPCLRITPSVYCIVPAIITIVRYVRTARDPTDTTIIRYVTKRSDTYRRLTSNIEGSRWKRRKKQRRLIEIPGIYRQRYKWLRTGVGHHCDTVMNTRSESLLGVQYLGWRYSWKKQSSITAG